MKVYVLIWHHCGDCGQICGVYSDQAQAYRARTALIGEVYGPPAHEVEVEEWQVQ